MASDLLDQIYFGNTVRDYALAVAVFAAITAIVWMLRHFLLHRLRQVSERTSVRFDDVLVASLAATKTVLVLVVTLVAASMVLERSERAAKIGETIAFVAILLQIGFWLSTAVHHSFRLFRDRKQAEGDSAGLGTASFLVLFLRMAVWALVALLVLANIGVDITAMVAGLGIGGIAIALALQNVLADVFASISILLDKPFVVGDSIMVGDLTGTVEKIGIKTTRVRSSLAGEQLVFSNADLLASRIRNFKRMTERRVSFAVNVTQATPPDRLAAIPELLREAVESQAKTRFDRAHFKSFGPSSFDFEVVYRVLEPSYDLYMDIQQQINLHVVRAFEREEISIACAAGPDGSQSARPAGGPAGWIGAGRKQKPQRVPKS